MIPSNCTTCEHKQNPGGGHCYLFRFAPEVKCVYHTDQFERSQAKAAQDRAIAERLKGTTWVKRAPRHARQPLTDEQIDNMVAASLAERDMFRRFARAIERAHGIGCET